MGMCIIPYTTVFKSENTKNRSILPNIHLDGGWFSGRKRPRPFSEFTGQVGCLKGRTFWRERERVKAIYFTLLSLNPQSLHQLTVQSGEGASQHQQHTLPV